MAMFTDDDIDFDGAVFFTDDDIDFEGAVFDDEISIDPQLEGADLSFLEEGQEELSPIQQEEQKFETEIAPIQQNVVEAAQQEATERTARREAGESTTGEKIEDVLFTTQVTESGATGSQALAEAGGLSSLPARALAKVFKFGEEGDITSEQTKLLEPAITALNEWGQDPDNQGLMDKAAVLVGNIALETISDPAAIFSVAKNAVRSTAKALGMQATKKQVDDLAQAVVVKAEGNIAKAGKKAKATDLKAEEALVEAGGPEQVVKNLEDKGIGLTTSGERSIPQEKVKEVVQKLKEAPVEEFDITDKIEGTIVPLNKKDLIKRSLRGEITDANRLEDVSDALSKSGQSVSETAKVLRNAGFESPGQVSSFITKLSGDVSGKEARDLITLLNDKVGDPSRSLSQSKAQLNKFNVALKEELKKAVGKDVPDDALEDYINLREAGTKKFATKTSKLANVVSRNPDKTINELKSTENIGKMVKDAMDEIGRGEKGLAFDNLKEIDELIGSDLADIAENAGLDKRFALDVEGKIGALPADSKKPPKRSIVEGSVLGGSAGGTAIALRNVGSDLIDKSNRKAITKLVRTVSKERGKIKLSKERLKAISKDIDEGKEYLLSEIDRGNAMKVFDAMTSSGVITTKRLVETIGKEKAAELAAENINSEDPKSRSLAKKLQRLSK